MAKTIIGVMGPGANPTNQDLKDACELGKLIAQQGWVLLTGGRNAGVMEAASQGASEKGGQTVGILPGSDRKGMSKFVDIPIITGMGSARNNINILSSDVVVACGAGAGTTSEIMLALKAGKQLVLLNQTDKALSFFKELGNNQIYIAVSPTQAIDMIHSILNK